MLARINQRIPFLNLAITFLFLSIVPIGCSTRPTGEIKIGVMTPLTGDVASWGQMQKRATQLALDDIKDLHIKVVFEDDQADPKSGVNAFTKLAEVDKVPIIVGSPASNVTLAVAPIANSKQVVLLSSGSTATAVGQAGPYVFRIMPSDEVQSTIMAEWAIELGLKRVAVLYEENAWGRGLMEAFAKDFPAKGGVIVRTEAAAPAATDFRTQLAKIKSDSVDAVFAPLYTRGAGLMIKQARELGITQQILGADVYETPELVSAGGSAVDGVLFTTYGQVHSAKSQEFAARYKTKFGLDVEAYATYCYDAFMIAAQALRKVQEAKQPLTGPSIREALLSISNYTGVTGLSDFNGKTSASGKTFDKMTIRNGKVVPY